MCDWSMVSKVRLQYFDLTLAMVTEKCDWKGLVASRSRSILGLRPGREEGPPKNMLSDENERKDSP
ncbi:hypothetical protein E2C01_010280 [Portunus trituberculatus]|uniref:Uncharacterized protein n=1 Tax=Portunus trituberculatus TaxID=210409 RepID=A0A5B7D894_PORTR|nr:hypothetical protein [Portunus trituberculatus]